MLKFSNVSLYRGGCLLFQQASITIPARKKVGVTGRNGVGKSSLFSLVLGDLEPDKGEFDMPSDLTIAQVAQETPAIDKPAVDYVIDGDGELRHLQAQLELAEKHQDGVKQAQTHNRLNEIQGYSAKARAAKLMAGLGFKPSQENWSVLQFSGGWRKRLNLAQALMCRSDLLVLDEPTNHLDLDAVIWVQDWLLKYSGTLLLISHDRDFLDNITNYILHIEHQTVTLYPGNYSAFESICAQRLAQHQAQLQKQQREIAHIREFVDRFRAKATKARQAQSRIKKLEKLELIAKAHTDSPFHFDFKSPEKIPNPLLNIRSVSVGYGDTDILKDINLTIMPGDRIGLLGRNGAGKSTFIKLLAGRLRYSQGESSTAEACRIGYFAQHQLEQLNEAESALYHLHLLDVDASEKDLRSFLGGFSFSGDRAMQPISTFSGGEKSRLGLAIIVYQKPNLLLLDEPTNHLDLEMRHALGMALQDFEGAILIVSHDRHLLQLTVDQFLLVADGCVSRFDGDIDDYRRWLAEHQKARESKPIENSQTFSGKDRRRLDAELRQRLHPFRKTLKEAEQIVEKLNLETERLENLLGDPALYGTSKKQQLKKLLLEKAKIGRETGRAEANWLAASEALEHQEQL